MAGANKTLTVSYGTFSCTLDGVDDPVEMMRALADYLREIDAQESDQPVADRIGSDGVVLRATARDDPPPAVASAAVTGEDTAPDPPGGDDPASVAAKLARIRALVEQDRTQPPVDPDLAARAPGLGSSDALPAPDVLRADLRPRGDALVTGGDAPPESPAPEPHPKSLLRLRPEDLVEGWRPTSPAQRRLPPLRLSTAWRTDLGSEEWADGSRRADHAAGNGACIGADASRSAAKPEHAAGERSATPPLALHEEALQRLLDETNSKLEGAEQKQRQASIAHVRAAVAAVAADRALQPKGSAPRDANGSMRPYRHALAKALRSDGDAGAARNRRVGMRLPPLILVPEQRIDRPAPDPATSPEAIRPAATRRRPVRSTGRADAGRGRAGNTETGTISFEDFVARRGVATAAETVEAAAIYVLAIEGATSFGRPRVMHLAMDHLGGEAQREDVLRAFAGLLRTGRFERIGRGEFIIGQPGAATRSISGRREA